MRARVRSTQKAPQGAPRKPAAPKGRRKIAQGKPERAQPWVRHPQATSPRTSPTIAHDRTPTIRALRGHPRPPTAPGLQVTHGMPQAGSPTRRPTAANDPRRGASHPRRPHPGPQPSPRTLLPPGRRSQGATQRSSRTNPDPAKSRQINHIRSTRHQNLRRQRRPTNSSEQGNRHEGRKRESKKPDKNRQPTPFQPPCATTASTTSKGAAGANPAVRAERHANPKPEATEARQSWSASARAARGKPVNRPMPAGKEAHMSMCAPRARSKRAQHRIHSSQKQQSHSRKAALTHHRFPVRSTSGVIAGRKASFLGELCGT